MPGLGELFNVGISVTIIDHFSNMLHTLTSGMMRTRLTAGGFENAVNRVSGSLHTSSIVALEHNAKLNVLRATLQKNTAQYAIQSRKVDELTGLYARMVRGHRKGIPVMREKIALEKSNLDLLKARGEQEELEISRSERLVAAQKNQAIALGLLAGAAASFGAARLSYGMLKSTIQPGADLEQQIDTLKMQGESLDEIKKNTAASFELASKMPAIRASEALRDLIEARVFMGGSDFAREVLPDIEQARLTLEASSDVKTKEQALDFARSMSKAADMFGMIDKAHPEKFRDFLEIVTKSAVVSRGIIAPSDWQLAAKYGSPAHFMFSHRFLSEVLPVMMMEYKSSGTGGGGGARGSIGPLISSTLRELAEGRAITHNLPILQSFGLLPKGVDITKEKYSGGVIDSAMLASDPDIWVKKYLIPSLEKKAKSMFGKDVGALSDTDMMKIVDQLTANRSTARWLSMLIKGLTTGQFDRYKKIYEATPGLSKMYEEASKSPRLAFRALEASLYSLKESIGVALMPIIIPAIIKLAFTISKLAAFFGKHDWYAKAVGFGLLVGVIIFSIGGLVLAFGALAVMLGAGGVVTIFVGALMAIAGAIAAVAIPTLGLAYELKYALGLAIEYVSKKIQGILTILKIVAPILAPMIPGGRAMMNAIMGPPESPYTSAAKPTAAIGEHNKIKTIGHAPTTVNFNGVKLDLSKEETDFFNNIVKKTYENAQQASHTTTTGAGPDESQYLTGADY